MKKATGAFLAATVAGLFMTGKLIAQSQTEAAKPEAKSAKVHCEGVNGCKGKGACKGADNSCGGKNGCKGKGWVEMTKDECDAAKAKQKKS